MSFYQDNLIDKQTDRHRKRDRQTDKKTDRYINNGNLMRPSVHWDPIKSNLRPILGTASEKASFLDTNLTRRSQKTAWLMLGA